jgi:hypothetical protein
MTRSTPPRHGAPPKPLDLNEVLRRLQRLEASANDLIHQLARRPTP